MQASQWWDPQGPAGPLHRLNPLRLSYIRASIEKTVLCAKDFAPGNGGNHGRDGPLSGVSIVDAGCGGGIVAEPLARLGAKVLGIDMAREAIDVAKGHMVKDVGLLKKGLLSYRECAVEDLVNEGRIFDTVLALEIVEHVTDPAAFLKNCSKLVADGGLLVLSTLNRTFMSYVLGIIAAERIFGWLPPGTHDWERFPKPGEVKAVLESQTNMSVSDIVGVQYNPFNRKFRLSENVDINYILTAVAGSGNITGKK